MKRKIIGILCIAESIGAAIVINKLWKQLKKEKKLADKHLELFLTMNQWVKVKQIGKDLSSYFEREGYREIAIYGMHYAGETLVEELMGSDIIIKYAIDQKMREVLSGVHIVTPDSDLREVDAIVVTPISAFGEIKQTLEKKVDCPIISLEDVLYLV